MYILKYFLSLIPFFLIWGVIISIPAGAIVLSGFYAWFTWVSDKGDPTFIIGLTFIASFVSCSYLAHRSAYYVASCDEKFFVALKSTFYENWIMVKIYFPFLDKRS